MARSIEHFAAALMKMGVLIEQGIVWKRLGHGDDERLINVAKTPVEDIDANAVAGW
ncbi:MAG: hypothetical protein ACRD0W_05630 [Acidimicrobiales bacterium]